jgi:hypothetical protein
MNPEKSDWGPQTVPASAEYVIRHVSSTISFNYTQDGTISRVDIVPDNQERITNANDDFAVWTRAYWSGDTLVLEARERKRYGTQENTGTTWTSRWRLSSNGKELIIERTIRHGEQQAAQKIVFDRQPLPRK